MLQPGERIDNHDRVCAEYYSSLQALGMYDDEFAFFAVAYIKEGRSKCYISADRNKILEFIRECREQQIYPTMMNCYVKRLRVHSGEKEKVEQKLKVDFAKELKNRYPHDFLMQLQMAAHCPINNKAAEILNPLRDTLEGCFDEGALQLYKGAVELAYDGKILTAAEYHENKLWLKREGEFLNEKLRKVSNFKRILTGFGYINEGKIKYYSTALEERTIERRLELMSAGKIVSPIYKEEYCFNNYADLTDGLKKFEEILAQRIDSNYMQLIIDLNSIKPEINKELLDKIMAQYISNKHISKTIGYYRSLWHLNISKFSKS